MVRLFGGTVFWDDVITEMRRDGFRFARRIVGDLDTLEPQARARALLQFLEFGRAEPGTLIKFLLVLHEKGSPRSLDTYNELVDLYFQQAPGFTDFVERICRLFKTRPRILNRFVETLDPGRRARLEELLDARPLDPEVAETLSQIRRFIELRTRGSEFYRRIFRRVMTKYPRFIHYVSEARRLHRFSDGLFTRALSLDDFEISRQALADYYDVQYLACAVRAILGEEPLEYRSRFIEFADNYLRSIHRLCTQEEAERSGKPLGGKDLFGVFATGGYAREQAFDDDYDLLLVLNSDDPALFESVSKVWSKVHLQIARRGTLPQYRFGDHFGSFVTRASDLKQFLASGQADLVDKAQLLGIRQIIGSTRLLRFLKDTMIEPHILAQADQFVEGIVEDIRDRATHPSAEAGLWVDIKEAPGGMRDIEQTMLALSARFALVEPVTYRLFDRIGGLAPDLAPALQDLRQNHHLLREVRDLYRILVAAADDIHLEWLGPVAKVVASHRAGFDGSAQQLFDSVLASMERVRELVTQLLGAASVGDAGAP
jgi:glutamine synthetase adenylyltransferase